MYLHRIETATQMSGLVWHAYNSDPTKDLYGTVFMYSCSSDPGSGHCFFDIVALVDGVLTGLLLCILYFLSRFSTYSLW